ncbi:hypothetical protein MLD38_024675 [Melastoma candidum]|uniref:Uncharacterized protein n=1 Tax=Melastoma candidum TaxID=119954 RepID=A0ACB9NUC6_9MYRT|nr:hypothetical protein MLD38_024675 [Melastoma candidum]
MAMAGPCFSPRRHHLSQSAASTPTVLPVHPPTIDFSLQSPNCPWSVYKDRPPPLLLLLLVPLPSLAELDNPTEKPFVFSSLSRGIECC